MNIKTMLKKSKNGDTFAKQIHSKNKKFDGRYFLFIRTLLDFRDDDDKNQIFRIKITKDKKLPTTLEEINSLEYIQTNIEYYDKAIDNYQNWINQNGMILCPDEFQYLYIFQSVIIPLMNSKYPNDLIYLGNYNVTPPQNEYIAYNIAYTTVKFWDRIDDDLIQCYYQYNKKDKSIFNQKESELKKKNYLEYKRIEDNFYNNIEKFEKMLFEKYGDELEKYFENEPYIEESETYVGDDEEPEE